MKIEFKDLMLCIGVTAALFGTLMFAVGYSSGKLQGLETGLTYTGVIK